MALQQNFGMCFMTILVLDANIKTLIELGL